MKRVISHRRPGLFVYLFLHLFIYLFSFSVQKIEMHGRLELRDNDDDHDDHNDGYVTEEEELVGNSNWILTSCKPQRSPRDEQAIRWYNIHG